MPIDKAKRLSKYPAAFHAVFSSPGEGRRVLLWVAEEEAEVKREARRFRSFLKALRTYTHHPTAVKGELWTARTQMKLNALGDWELWIVFSAREDRSILEALAAPVDFQNLMKTG